MADPTGSNGGDRSTQRVKKVSKRVKSEILCDFDNCEVWEKGKSPPPQKVQFFIFFVKVIVEV